MPCKFFFFLLREGDFPLRERETVRESERIFERISSVRIKTKTNLCSKKIVDEEMKKSKSAKIPPATASDQVDDDEKPLKSRKATKVIARKFTN